MVRGSWQVVGTSLRAVPFVADCILSLFVQSADLIAVYSEGRAAELWFKRMEASGSHHSKITTTGSSPRRKWPTSQSYRKSSMTSHQETHAKTVGNSETLALEEANRPQSVLMAGMQFSRYSSPGDFARHDSESHQPSPRHA